MSGVYRQRSYDNLQNGKSPFHRNSIKSLHLPPTYANQHHNQLSKKLSLNNLNVGNKYPQLSPLIHRGYSPSPQHQQQVAAQAIPSNFKYFSPQSKYLANVNYDTNSLPRYPYHKNRAIQSVHQHPHDGICMEHYSYGPIRHPTTPPPPPPQKCSMEEQVLLPTPTSSTSSGDTCSNSEWDPMIASGSSAAKRNFDHVNHYRTCKKQLQQATQMLHPNPQHQLYLDNYLHQLTHQSPYRKYLNAMQSHQLQLSPQNIHHMQHPPPPPPTQLQHNPMKRHSNAYEYHFTNFDLNSIHEDAFNES